MLLKVALFVVLASGALWLFARLTIAIILMNSDD